MSQSTNPVTITASAATWLEVGREIGGAKRFIDRLAEVIDRGCPEDEAGQQAWRDSLWLNLVNARAYLNDARLKWADLIEHQAPELPDEAQGGGA